MFPPEVLFSGIRAGYEAGRSFARLRAENVAVAGKIMEFLRVRVFSGFEAT